jgi:hypothetical protein
MPHAELKGGPENRLCEPGRALTGMEQSWIGGRSLFPGRCLLRSESGVRRCTPPRQSPHHRNHRMSISRSLLHATLPVLGLLALLASPFGMSTLAAADTDTSTLPIINTVCPMSGKTIDTAHCKMIMVTFGEGADAKKCKMAFSSEDACAEFMKDPATALKPWFIGPKGGDTRKFK